MSPCASEVSCRVRSSWGWRVEGGRLRRNPWCAPLGRNALRDVQPLGDEKAPNREFVDFKPSDPDSTDRQATDRQCADRHCADRHGPERQPACRERAGRQGTQGARRAAAPSKFSGRQELRCHALNDSTGGPRFGLRPHCFARLHAVVAETTKLFGALRDPACFRRLSTGLPQAPCCRPGGLSRAARRREPATPAEG